MRLRAARSKPHFCQLLPTEMRGFYSVLLLSALLLFSEALPLRSSPDRAARVKREEPTAKPTQSKKYAKDPPGLGGLGVRYPVCIYQLGVSNRQIIKDDQISASSYYGTKHLRPYQGRLGNNEGAWCAAFEARGQQYLQIDFGALRLVSGILTQGKSDTDDWVTQYRLGYSLDGQEWNIYKENGTEKVFRANKDRNSVFANYVKPRIVTRYVRILPQAWRGYLLCMRTEIIGCTIEQVNLALNQTAEQSSTQAGANASRAVDGNWEMDFEKGKKGRHYPFRSETFYNGITKGWMYGKETGCNLKDRRDGLTLRTNNAHNVAETRSNFYFRNNARNLQVFRSGSGPLNSRMISTARMN